MPSTYAIRAGAVWNNVAPANNPWTDFTGAQTNLVSDTWPTALGGSVGHYVQVGNTFESGTPTYILQYAADTANIYINGTPTAFSGLPAGFTPTSCQVSFTFTTALTATVYPRFDQFVEGPGTSVSSTSQLITFNYPGALPTSVSLVYGTAMGLRVVNAGGNASFTVASWEISGNYTTTSYTWYYNPNTNHYQYLSSNPGAPWIQQNPNLSVISVNPPQGPNAFPPAWNSALTYELATVTGTGIGDGAAVLLDGQPMTQTSTANQDSITGTVGGFAGTLSGPSIITVDGEDPAHSGQNLLADTNVGNVTVINPDGTQASLSNAWTYYQALQTWWQTVALPFIFFSYYSPTLTFPFGFFFDGIFYPPNIEFVWTNLAAPSTPGWWLSINQYFNGAAFDIASGTPHNPRTFDEIGVFATGSARMMGGFPGPSCVWNNRLIYAEGGYTVGTNQPPIDLYDGAFNHTVALVPLTTAGAVPIGVMTMLSANGTVYFTTLDTGTSSANFSGRVFSLNINTGQMIQLGLATDLATGDVPYALAFSLGKLWLGTNRADGTAGNIYFIRPGVDTNWTLDNALSNQSMGGCTSMVEYNGQLYIGTSAGSGTFATVLQRSTLGVYTASDTGSGGAAQTNNAYLAMTVFQGNLYATYWNGSSPAHSLVRQFNGTSWSTVYTGSGDTNVPLIALPTDSGPTPTMLALGGGLTYQAALASTTNGTSWVDNTAFLTQVSPARTATPVFGVVIR